MYLSTLIQTPNTITWALHINSCLLRCFIASQGKLNLSGDKNSSKCINTRVSQVQPQSDKKLKSLFYNYSKIVSIPCLSFLCVCVCLKPLTLVFRLIFCLVHTAFSPWKHPTTTGVKQAIQYHFFWSHNPLYVHYNTCIWKMNKGSER